MWILFACGSALFAGLTSVIAKIGLKENDSDVVTALRTGVVLIFAWLMVLVTGAFRDMAALDPVSYTHLAGTASDQTGRERGKQGIHSRGGGNL